MNQVKIAQSEIMQIASLTEQEIMWWNPRMVQGTTEWEKMFVRVFIGLAGEYAFGKWASNNGMHPIKNQNYKNDFRIEGSNIEVKSFRANKDRSQELHIHAKKYRSIKENSHILAFMRVNCAWIKSDPQWLAENYLNGFIVEAIGWLPMTHVLNIPTEDGKIKVIEDLLRSPNDLHEYTKIVNHTSVMTKFKGPNWKAIRIKQQKRHLKNYRHKKDTFLR